jgi:hypothetical protein
VPPEVVAVVQHQDARLGPGYLPKEIRRRQPAEAAAHHDQVVALAGLGFRPHVVPARAVAQRVRHLVGSAVAAPHPRRGRRVVRCLLLDRSCARRGTHFSLGSSRVRPRRGQHRAGDGYTHPVDEIAPRDRAIHPQLRIASLHAWPPAGILAPLGQPSAAGGGRAICAGEALAAGRARPSQSPPRGRIFRTAFSANAFFAMGPFSFRSLEPSLRSLAG